jgi:hypothetical protein
MVRKLVGVVGRGRLSTERTPPRDVVMAPRAYLPQYTVSSKPADHHGGAVGLFYNPVLYMR